MQHALELYNTQAYLKAEKAFIELRSSHPLESSKYLCLISKRLGKSDYKSRYNDYIAELFKSKNHKEIALFHNENQGPLSLRSQHNVLESFWATGSLDSFSKQAALAWNELIEKKYYAHSDDLFNLIKEKEPFLLINAFGHLTALLETHRHREAADFAIELLNMIQTHWGKIKTKNKNRPQVLKSLLLILKSVKPIHFELEKALFKMELENLIHGTKKAPNATLTRFAIEFAILFKDERKSLARLLMLENLPQKEVLEKYLDKKPENSMKDFIKKNVDSEGVFEDFEAFSDDLIDYTRVSQEETGPNGPESDSGANSISAEEEELLARIKAKDPDLVDEEKMESIAHSLYGIGFYEACIKLIDHARQKDRLAYLKCQALWETGKYLKLLDFSTNYSEGLEREDRVPFWYMGARGAMRLGKTGEARNLLRQIVKTDPNFRDAKELLRSETA